MEKCETEELNVKKQISFSNVSTCGRFHSYLEKKADHCKNMTLFFSHVKNRHLIDVGSSDLQMCKGKLLL